MDHHFDRARPIHVHRDNYEFVKPIDWGQIAEDRQKQINGAFDYIDGKRKYLFDHVRTEDVVSSGTKAVLLLWVFTIALFLLDRYDIINFGELLK